MSIQPRSVTLQIVVAQFLPTPAAKPATKCADQEAQALEIQVSLVKRLLSSALEVYSCSWFELVRKQVEDVKV